MIVKEIHEGKPWLKIEGLESTSDIAHLFCFSTIRSDWTDALGLGRR